jgi:hypothetical protein
MTAKAIGNFYNSTAAARFPVWTGSTTRPVKFRPLKKKDAARLFHDARRLERATRIKKGHQDGKLGRNGLAVLHALLFDFLNYVSGELFPSYQAIADRAAISVSSVYRGLVNLAGAGVLEWVKRCRREPDGTFVQESNAYHLHASSSWKGYAGAPRPVPPPHPSAIGAPDPVPDAFTKAAAALRAGDRKQGQAMLELAGEAAGEANALAGALARVARRRAQNGSDS